MVETPYIKNLLSRTLIRYFASNTCNSSIIKATVFEKVWIYYNHFYSSVGLIQVIAKLYFQVDKLYIWQAC